MNTQAIELPPSGEAAAILLPDPGTVFLARAERFDALALHHGLGEWLAFLGRLSRAQHAALEASAQDIAPPAEDVLARARKHRMPPISVASYQRPAVWREILRNLVGDLLENAPVGARETLDGLLVTSAEDLDKLGEKLLNGEPEGADMARLPYVAAAMQVVFTALASKLDADALPLMEAHSTCPVCGTEFRGRRRTCSPECASAASSAGATRQAAARRTLTADDIAAIQSGTADIPALQASGIPSAAIARVLGRSGAWMTAHYPRA